MFLFSKIQTLFSLIKHCFYVIRKNKFIIKTFTFYLQCVSNYQILDMMFKVKTKITPKERY